MNNDKTSINRDAFLRDVLFILRETFEGSPEGQSSAYLDRGVSVFSTLDGLSAEESSVRINSTSVAAHTEHAKFYLDRLVEFIEGRKEKVHWEQSWLIETVSTEEWDILRAGMKKSYDNVLRCFSEITDWNEETLGGAIAIIAHTAYHLGAIRQIMKGARI